MLKLEVVWGSLSSIDEPVLVGHCEGLPLGGAERALDRALEQRLSRHQLLHDYPGAIGTVELVLVPGLHPPGAIVVGLGPADSLTVSSLRTAVERVALKYALAKADLEAASLPADERISVTLSTVLLGTGGEQPLSVEESVFAIVQGVLAANSEIVKAGESKRVRVETLQFVELYRDRAEEAATCIGQIDVLLGVHVGKTFKLEVEKLVDAREGGLPRRPAVESEGNFWARVLIKSLDDKEGKRLELTWSGLGAAAGQCEAPIADDVGAMVEQVVGSSHVGPANTELFERLVPEVVRSVMGAGHDLLLVLDPESAAYPWELLAPTPAAGKLDALAARAGLLRQLTSGSWSPAVRGPEGLRALVVADPDTEGACPEIPGAEAEALGICRTLEEHGYDVTTLAGKGSERPGADDVLEAMSAREYRILHFIAHGEFDPERPEQSGVVIGPGQYLAANRVASLSAVPELVFLNCCHLGRTGPAPASGSEQVGLAASLSAQLMLRGARAVVASGWRLEARAAHAFSAEFYERLCAGIPFGKAVRLARGKCSRVDRNLTNTWGAYQCYGSPDYRIVTAGEGSVAPRSIVSPHQAKQRLEAITVRGADQGSSLARLAGELEELEHQVHADWMHGELRFYFGRAYASLGDFERAIEHYREGFESWDGGAPLSVLEQLANMEVRTATRLHRDATASAVGKQAPVNPRVTDLFASGKQRLELLLQIGPTPERHALLGSYFKKHATTLNGEARRTEIAKAASAYRDAHELGEQRGASVPYQAINWIAMSAMLGETTDEQRALIAELVARSGDSRESFWDRARPGDATLASALSTDNLSAATDEIVASYERAFSMAYEVRQALSVLENVDDLIWLAPPAWVEPLERIRAALQGGLER